MSALHSFHSDDNMPINLWCDDFIYIALRWQPAVYNKKQEIVPVCSIGEIKLHVYMHVGSQIAIKEIKFLILI